MYLVKSPFFYRWLFGNKLIWRIPVTEKILFLTFDDGPVPETTPDIISILGRYGIKATFFCVGENVKKHPAEFECLLSAGHAIGCHTFNHLKGWDYSTTDYVENVKKCSQYFQTSLFRPPYGRIKSSQIEALRQEYNIIMWSVLTGDFDRNTTPEQCLQNSIRYTKAGSIVVFHDNIKAKNNLQFALPKFIEHFLAQGYRFETLTEEILINKKKS